ncbi:MAG: aminotransferase class V-fold PLP-dependent enzyme [Verrucomicrobiota bacterium]
MWTPQQLQDEFPSLIDQTYLNTAAEGIPPLSSLQAFERYQKDKLLGMDGRDTLFETLESCRASAADLIGVPSDAVSFCSSTSEAYNLLATAVRFPTGAEAVVANLDFPSGATPWLCHPDEPIVRVWQDREGSLELSDLAPLLNEETRLVQLSLVSFLTGYRLEWNLVRNLVREKAPNAILAVDVTQAAGRVVLDCLDADCLVASGYKWLLGSHGSALVVVPDLESTPITTQAGGWYHLANAFDEDRFERVEPFRGAPGFSVGMPSFPALYSLKHGLDFLRKAGVPSLASHADALVARLHEGLANLGIQTMSPAQPGNSSGIVSFQSESDEKLNQYLRKREIHVMHQAGRIRISIHGYNTKDDVDRLLEALGDYLS